MPEVLSTLALNRATLARQWLLARQDSAALHAIEQLIGLQAQAPFPPYYGLWCRLERFTAAELSGLLLNRVAVRLVLMRGTVHLVSTRDALPLRTLMQPIMDRDLHTNQTYAPLLAGLEFQELARRGRELLDGQALTLPELRVTLAELYPERDPAALTHALRNLLPLVQVPPRAVWGKSGQVKYQTVEGWTGTHLETGLPLEELIRRYLRAFGPASVQDAQQWSGLTRLGEVFERLRPHFVTFHDETDTELFDLPDGPRPPPDTPAPARLLPAFDNLLLSHANRRRVMTEAVQKRVFGVKNGVFPNTILIDGFVAGTWTLEQKRPLATLILSPYQAVSNASRKELSREAERLLNLAAPESAFREVQFT